MELKEDPVDRISFEGRTVVVTGSGHNLGAEYAREFGGRGARVVVNDIDRTAADGTVDQIRAAGGTAVASDDSVGEVDGAAALIHRAAPEFGRGHAPINNPGWN